MLGYHWTQDPDAERCNQRHEAEFLAALDAATGDTHTPTRRTYPQTDQRTTDALHLAHQRSVARKLQTRWALDEAERLADHYRTTYHTEPPAV